MLFASHAGLMQVALAWGIGVTLAIYLTRHLSCTHLNPAGRVTRPRLHRVVGGFHHLSGGSAYPDRTEPRARSPPRLVAWLLRWGGAAFPDRAGGFFHV